MFGGEGAFDGPSPIQAVGDGLAGDTDDASPLAEVSGGTVVSDFAICPCVVCLQVFGSPSAVSGFIVTVNVPAVDFVSCGDLALLCEESREV